MKESTVPIPFTYGNPISDPQRFFGRHAEVELIFSRLRNPEFESSSVVGERKVGKTSLLNYIAHPQVVRRYNMDPETLLIVYMDLAMITSATTPSRLYQLILRRLRMRVQDPQLQATIQEVSQSETLDVYDLSDLLEGLEGRGLRLVLLLDEFDHLGSNENFGPEFYYGLRSLAIHYNLAIVTASRLDLIDVCHSAEVRSSPFFNIFANIYLPAFSREDVDGLLKGSLQGTGIAFTQEEVEYAAAFAGRLPFFLQIAFHALFEARQQGMPMAPALDYLRQRLGVEASPHLSVYWQHSSFGEQLVLATLALRELDEEVPPTTQTAAAVEELYRGAGAAIQSLTRRGLVRASPEGCALFSTAFAAWLRSELTSPRTEVEASEETTEQAGRLLASLPATVQAQAKQWLRETNPRYGVLALHWLAASPKPQNVLHLLSRSTPSSLLQTGTAPAQPAAAAESEEASLPLEQAESIPQIRQAIPQGIISILFTDLEGSTALFTRLGDAETRGLLDIHNRIIREQVTLHGGVEVKFLGDGFLIVFASALRAVQCAQEMQLALDAYSSGRPDKPLRVRMGLHAGEVLQGQELLGSAVNLAARVMQHAAGGEILVSEVFYKLLSGQPQIRFLERGARRLSGFPGRQRLFQVRWRPAS